MLRGAYVRTTHVKRMIADLLAPRCYAVRKTSRYVRIAADVSLLPSTNTRLTNKITLRPRGSFSLAYI